MTTTMVSRYYVTAAPPERQGAGHDFYVSVELVLQMDGTEKWAVRYKGRAMHHSGRWDWEMQPSSRNERWLASHRFDLRTALRLAEKAAPHITVNGVRPDGSLVEEGSG